MKRAGELNLFKGFTIRSNGPTISYLQYADDTLCIDEASVDNLWTMKALLRGFKLASGLKVNFWKSCLIGVNVDDNFMDVACSFLNCIRGEIPFKYLGLPVGASPRRMSTWEPMVEKIKDPDYIFFYRITNQMSLEIAVEATTEFLNKAKKPVMIGGPMMRIEKAASDSFMEMADASGYAIAILPSAKGMVSENHPHFIGTYWGVSSTSFCAEIIESSDAYLFAGPLFNDIISMGHSLLIKKEKSITVLPDKVVIGNGPTFGNISMKEFFEALTKRLERNTTAIENYRRICIPDGFTIQCNPKEALRINVLFKHIQNMLSCDTAVIAECGDAWFNCQKLKLPQGCGYECQMQYSSLGWSIGATLGYAKANPQKRVIACIGDGCFQVSGQEVSTMLRCRQNVIIFLINNGGYTTEAEIHDGPYNVIKNWNYAGLVETIDNGEGKCFTTKVHCEEELIEAINTTMESKMKCLCFIEVVVHKDDTSKELLQLGYRLASLNGRLPKDY